MNKWFEFYIIPKDIKVFYAINQLGDGRLFDFWMRMVSRLFEADFYTIVIIGIDSRFRGNDTEKN